MGTDHPLNKTVIFRFFLSSAEKITQNPRAKEDQYKLKQLLSKLSNSFQQREQTDWRLHVVDFTKSR